MQSPAKSGFTYSKALKVKLNANHRENSFVFLVAVGLKTLVPVTVAS